MTFDRSLLCSIISFHRCMNPSESMSNVRENCPIPLLSIPCDEELSLATSTPTKSSGMAPPPCFTFRQDRVCLPALPGLPGPIILSWLREAGNRLYSGFFDPGRTAFSCLTDRTLFISHLLEE